MGPPDRLSAVTESPVAAPEGARTPIPTRSRALLAVHGRKRRVMKALLGDEVDHYRDKIMIKGPQGGRGLGVASGRRALVRERLSAAKR